MEGLKQRKLWKIQVSHIFFGTKNWGDLRRFFENCDKIWRYFKISISLYGLIYLNFKWEMYITHGNYQSNKFLFSSFQINTVTFRPMVLAPSGNEAIQPFFSQSH